ncbi:hypothetical protein K8R33_04525 [archaeon]|nr:hypothetical protein [archaeon]
MIDIILILGGIGLILIILGVIVKRRGFKETRRNQDLYYIFGGIFLLIYSISIKNYIFIVLQLLFILAALWDYKKRK